MRVLLPRSPLTDPVFDDRSARCQVIERGPSGVKEAVDVHCECARPLFVGQLRQVVHRRLVRHVVDQYLESAEILNGPLDHVGAHVPVGEITAIRDAAPPFRLDELHRSAGVVAFGEVGNGDVCTLFCERDSHRSSNAGVTPGDEGSATFQQPSPDVVSHRVSGLLAHRMGVAGVRNGLFVVTIRHV